MLVAIEYNLNMRITFDSFLCIEKIKYSNKTFTLNIVYKNDERIGFNEDKGNRIFFQSPVDFKGIEVSEAEIIFENVHEIWWDDWWDEDKDKERINLNTIEIDNKNWRFDILEQLQYNAPKTDVDVNDLNYLNVSDWESALSWGTLIEVDSEDFLKSKYHLTLNIRHDLKNNKKRSMQYGPLHVKGQNMKIETKLNSY